MDHWTSGYVADINYTHGFYKELTPALLAFVALAKGQRGPDPSAPLSYCELGCGQGFSANLLAAANPSIEFYANDFNPAQIAGARALANEGGVRNVHFSDQSFQQYVDDASLPAFDIITLHGIYSWVSAENRRAIVDFIAKKLKVGGLVYISYNTLPGWAAAMPLRRLFVDHAATTGGPLALRIEKALVFAERLKNAKAAYFRDTNGVSKRLDNVKSQNRSYLAHEYFNRDWTPLYFSDVAAELAAAKLSHLGSAHLLDHIGAVNFTPEHEAMLNEASDPLFRETVRDYLTLQQFRRDVFVRGALGLNVGQAQEAWLSLRLALLTPRADFSFKISGPLGEIAMQESAYAPILDALAKGPKTVKQLLSDPAIEALRDQRMEETIKVLIGSGHVQPCLPAQGEADRAKRTRMFNSAVLKRAAWSNDLQFLASPVTGGGVPLDRFQQMFLLAHLEKHSDIPQRVWEQIAGQKQTLLKDGKPLSSPEDNLAELRSRYESFQSKALPILQQLGIV